ncbi:hypothetical protein H8A99_42080 [Bradyrhizobium sp. Arg68]|uniref:hypothetical protein n=1 Tax=Bradyrhizobium ivorense TaxID=2511166 RepID=UPI001E40EDA2|nr:hypothetical protein [Bradyrhizobium ivorense]MCC8942828.1 hypothetical protein [Bradyrhizobium ivorense]
MAEQTKYQSVAYCSWSWRVAPGHPWESLGSPPSVCRASVGEKIVTVWLPRGAVIRLRRARWRSDLGKYRHVYGRDRDNLIEIYVPDAVRDGRAGHQGEWL